MLGAEERQRRRDRGGICTLNALQALGQVNLIVWRSKRRRRRSERCLHAAPTLRDVAYLPPVRSRDSAPTSGLPKRAPVLANAACGAAPSVVAGRPTNPKTLR